MPGCRVVPPTTATLAAQQQGGEEPLAGQENIRVLTAFLLCGCVQVKQDDYNISAGPPDSGLFSVSSSLVLTAETSSHVDCLASVSALAQPLRASVGLTVGETTQEHRPGVQQRPGFHHRVQGHLRIF